MATFKKITILTCLDHYLPGYKSGGPIRSVANLVQQLGTEFDFKIVTRDRDARDSGPYAKIDVNQWQRVGRAEVYYASPDRLVFWRIGRLIRETPHDILYINSVFSLSFSIQVLVLRRIGFLNETPLILAPKGEVSVGALSVKPGKKKLYLSFARILGLYDQVTWQASSEYERDDIARTFPSSSNDANRIFVAPDLPTVNGSASAEVRSSKKAGRLKIVFLSRISPKKNLHQALNLVKTISAAIEFDVYGPIADEAYWKKCERVIQAMPPSVRVSYKGIVEHQHVAQLLSSYDLFFLPTLNENYGHVIWESLAAGCPVLISDQTAWRGLQREGVGWDIPLNQEDQFTAVIRSCVDMDTAEHEVLCQAARRYAQRVGSDDEIPARNRALFRAAVGAQG